MQPQNSRDIGECKGPQKIEKEKRSRKKQRTEPDLYKRLVGKGATLRAVPTQLGAAQQLVVPRVHQFVSF